MVLSDEYKEEMGIETRKVEAMGSGVGVRRC